MAAGLISAGYGRPGRPVRRGQRVVDAVGNRRFKPPKRRRRRPRTPIRQWMG